MRFTQFDAFTRLLNIGLKSYNYKHSSHDGGNHGCLYCSFKAIPTIAMFESFVSGRAFSSLTYAMSPFLMASCY